MIRDEGPVRVMVVEDEAVVRLHLRRMLAGLGYQVVGAAATADEAVVLAEIERPDLVLMDIDLRGEADGIDAANRLRALYDPGIVFLTAYADAATIRRTEEVGAVGFIVKPYSHNEVRAVLSTAEGVRRRLQEAGASVRPGAVAATGPEFHGMIGVCPAMKTVYQRIAEVAPLDWTVLIEGETGTGKELAARALHALGPRLNRPFVPVNCAGLTESLMATQLFGHRKGTFTGAVRDQKGFFEEAHGGTLFLDEIADMSAGTQQALLRVLEDGLVQRVGEAATRPVDVRIISATQRSLADEVAAGRFRADLLYRLRAVRVELPPLRNRGEDIHLLADRFLAVAVEHTGLPVAGFDRVARLRLEAYAWPGNVRELRHVVDHAVLACRSGQIAPAHLPDEVSPATPGTGPFRAGDERTRIFAALEQAGGNRTEAARLLGISRATLYRRFQALGIGPEADQESGQTGETL